MADERLSVKDAATRLGITSEAVRQRIRRKALRTERDTDGHLVVLLSPEDTEPNATSHADRSVSEAHRELVATLRAENERLWQELQTRDEEIRRRDVLLRDALDWRAALPSGQSTAGTPDMHPQQEPKKRGWWSRFVA